MTPSISSRDRMLAALECREPDHVPCSFMLFNALRQKCSDQFRFVERQLALGLDATVGLPIRSAQRQRDLSEQGDLHGLPVRWQPEVTIREWREEHAGERYPLLHREYATPAGRLHTSVSKTDDWTHGDRVPLFDDFVIPRARERLVTGTGDLPALQHLLTPPTQNDVATFREGAQAGKAFAAKHALLTVGEWGVGWDAACWLCGIEPLVLAALDNPEFVQALVELIGDWNRRRMAIVLEAGVDLYLRRAWYEGADFLSPRLYRRFVLPQLKQDAELAHQAGAKLACIMTAGYVPLLDLLLESGVDALIGLDPVQDHRADFALTKGKLGGKVCLWGGVNGFVTMERGTPAEVRQAVKDAVTVLAPGGGFILSPVDNVTVDTERVWENVDALIEEWRATW
ncbi:MAG: hypothetical protein CO096_32820 [Armatimonadetes bacterium CG_4_9_14_3_um_filter_66_14]|nr:hypothetical protein [Armatimonadota bacterium]PIU93598.1 MAG: hypothetical protein COS65_11980 [Armatimonadetes bacterium CG06_land_8_20_14_3_00_66_21]PJB60646.1 MAG: hypothetical protein CO096_32820 [Armatimonadetes bacterium CG_4_9_14_3_um_filter_66_14]